MKLNCEIIRDLLPSYIDGLTSQESNRLVEEHLESCAECREYLKEMQADLSSEASVEKNKKAIRPFRKLNRRVKMSVEASGSIATLRFTPQEDTVLYVEADENEENTIVITEGYRNPLKKVYQKSAYYGYTFIDKNTVMGLNGKSTKIDEDDVLTIRYEDKTETISMQELAKEALANNPERTFSE